MSLLLSLYLVAMAAPTQNATACGITFQVPHSWYAAETRPPETGACVVTIRARDWVATIGPGQPELTSTVRVTVTNEPFARAAASSGFEETARGRWELPSDGSAKSARAISAGSFRGLDVSHAGALFHPKRSASIDQAFARITLLEDSGGKSVKIVSGPASEQAHALFLSSLALAPAN